MIIDACVLIDFIQADRYVLGLIVKHVGPLYVVPSIVDEVNDLEIDELIDLGLLAIEPEVEDAFDAANKKGAVSFNDHLCLLTAKRQGFTCVTNDKNLRKECSKEKVPFFWGLELLRFLYNEGGMSSDSVISLAREIHQNNPRHITVEIFERFEKSIK
jgi:predicted nucleic acid-binding protein